VCACTHVYPSERVDAYVYVRVCAYVCVDVCERESNYLCVRACVRTCVCVCTCVRARVYGRTSVCVRVPVFRGMCVRMCVFECICMCLIGLYIIYRVWTYMEGILMTLSMTMSLVSLHNPRIMMVTPKYIRTHVHTHTQTHIHTHTHTHTRTNTQTHSCARDADTDRDIQTSASFLIFNRTEAFEELGSDFDLLTNAASVAFQG